MSEPIVLKYKVTDGEFQHVGEASSSVKKELRALGVSPDALRRISVAMYEGEVNMVIHANGGTITVEITPQQVKMILDDVGPGIPDLEKAMQAGWSTAPDEIRNLGFGAGMGLPNMKANTDTMEIDTRVGEGTRITMTVNL
ncbi:MAG: ATP-binding protein [Lachnospiraceae bacterium]|nr:ATP-binding protein [Lachnospiraceae bacterium]